MRKQLGLSFALVHDANQRIARTYGVRCWPTTIRINAAGLLEHTQFGVYHEHQAPPQDRRDKAEST
jgi:hypothetical protein